jgi:hypothetical protein
MILYGNNALKKNQFTHRWRTLYMYLTKKDIHLRVNA